MNRSSGLSPISAKRRAQLAAQGVTNPMSTFSPKPLSLNRGPGSGAKRKAPAGTGPDAAMVDLVLEAHQHSCAMCGYGLGDRRSIDYSIHHRVLRSQGVDNSFPNLIPLCGSGTTGDHGAVHAKPKWGREFGGWILKGFDDPATFPVLLERGARWALLIPDGTTKTVPAPEWAMAA